MLIGIVGPPLSGKTTIAAKFFSSLKETGVESNYLEDYCKKQIRLKNDFNQNKLLFSQIQEEIEVKNNINNKHIYISDNSYFNRIPYIVLEGMDKYPETKIFDLIFKQIQNHYDLIVYCHPLHSIVVYPESTYKPFNLNSITPLHSVFTKTLERIKQLKFPLVELNGDTPPDIRLANLSLSAMTNYAIMAK